MESFVKAFEAATKAIHDLVVLANSYLADYVLIILLVGTGLFFTFKTKFVQVRCFGEGMKKVFGNLSLRGGKNQSGLSSFQALATAIAAQVGTGNIIGATGAILIGGPGAIFWMWIIAFLGMATIYAEATLAQKTRIIDADGAVQGGPVYYIKAAFKGKFGKFLAGFFAVAIILALGFMGTMVQSNSIGGSVSNAFTAVGVSVPTYIIGIIVALIAAFIFIGGVNRIASVTEKLVPIMAVIYIVGCLAIIGIRYNYILDTFGLIFKFAFTPDALIGGGIGYAFKTAISQGAKRGLFSNEAGMGSTPHAHALANVKTPHEQGVVAMIGVFIDTFIALTLTALVVISNLYAGNGKMMDYAVASAADKSEAAQMAFSNTMGSQLGSIFVAVCLFFFAFSTIIGWNLFGKINVEYLFGKKAVIIYSVVALIFIVLGSFLSSDLVWELADFFNYLMVIPNVIALIALSKWVKDSALKKD